MRKLRHSVASDLHSPAQLESARTGLQPYTQYTQWSPRESDKVVPLNSMALILFLRLLGKLPFGIVFMIWIDVLD